MLQPTKDGKVGHSAEKIGGHCPGGRGRGPAPSLLSICPAERLLARLSWEGEEAPCRGLGLEPPKQPSRATPPGSCLRLAQGCRGPGRKGAQPWDWGVCAFGRAAAAPPPRALFGLAAAAPSLAMEPWKEGAPLSLLTGQADPAVLPPPMLAQAAPQACSASPNWGAREGAHVD